MENSQISSQGPESTRNGVIVVPCYNESKRLPVAAFQQFVSQNPSVRFLFVNDGSKDSTVEVIEAMRRDFEQDIQLLDKKINAGKGEAVRDGMLFACQDPSVRFVGFWDADLATPLDTIPLFLHHLDADSSIQMVFGSRVRLLGREVHRKASRHYLGRIFATAVSIILKLPIYDTQCGAKIFRNTPELATVLAQPFISPWVFDVEILARWKVLRRSDPEYLHRLIYELPLPRWEDVAGSKVHSGDFFRAFVDILRIYRRYLA